MTEEVEDVGHEQQVEKAFTESHGHDLNGLKLFPYSEAHQIAAQSMNLRYGTLTEEQAQQFKETSLYPGAVRDTGLILWLCSISDEQTLDRIAANPDQYNAACRKFVVEQKLVDTSQKSFWDGYTVFVKIMNEVEVSRVTAKKKMETESTKPDEKKD